MIRPKRQVGFTLVELLLASVVTVMVAAATVVILRSTTALRKRADHQVSVQQNARRAMRTMSSALRNAFRPLPGQEALLEGTDDWQNVMPADRIRFFTISPSIVREGTPESDVKECEFFLSEPVDQTLPALMLRLDPTRNESPDGGGVLQCVARNVAGLDVAYHDGQQWYPDWPEETQSWPEAIRIRLGVVDPQTRKTVWMTQRIVTHPRLARRTQQQQQQQETTTR